MIFLFGGLCCRRKKIWGGIFIVHEFYFIFCGLGCTAGEKKFGEGIFNVHDFFFFVDCVAGEKKIGGAFLLFMIFVLFFVDCVVLQEAASGCRVSTKLERLSPRLEEFLKSQQAFLTAFNSVYAEFPSVAFLLCADQIRAFVPDNIIKRFICNFTVWTVNVLGGGGGGAQLFCCLCCFGST